jgi:NTE family protein
VLAGGGARGAYEAGVLAELLPELERRGERPALMAGASVGAINATALASRTDMPAAQATEELLDIWRAVGKGDVIAPILGKTGPLAAIQYVGQLLRVPGLRLPSLLDSRPLWRNVEEWVRWPQLHEGARSGTLDTLLVVATSARTGKTVVFFEGAPGHSLHRSHAIAYVETEIAMEHVRASGAIPVIWPPAHVTTPARATGWYFDGGTRLNTPIKPVLDIGADQIVVVGVDSIAGPTLTREEPDAEIPDFGDGILHLLEGALVDPVIDDIRKLGNINTFMAGDAAGDGPKLYRTTRGKLPYREIPYIFIGPERRGQIGELASTVFRERYGGLKSLRSPDFRLINELLGGDSPTHGELLSLLFFDREFIEELIDLGRQDTRRWLAEAHDGEGPWQIGPLSSLVLPRQWTAG